MTLTLGVEMTVINCGECGGSYAINERYRQKQEKYGKCWNCPYCQTRWGYAGRGTVEQLRRTLSQKTQALLREQAKHDQTRAELETTERKRRAAKGLATRRGNQLARVQDGTCPCCDKQFADLEQHMRDEHPAFTTVDASDSD